MDAILFLFAGQNIPFLVALGCAIILALIQIVAGFGDQDADADADIDADADADADIDADADADAHGHGGAHAAGPLSALGIGKVPLMLVFMGFLGSFGAVGLIANSLLGLGGAYPEWGLGAVLVASLIAALPLTSGLSGMFARFAPRSSTAVTFEQLVGRVGTVVTPSVSATYGRVVVRDIHGSTHTVYAVVEKHDPLPERSEVALLRYDAAQRRFIVAPLGDARRRRRARA